MPNISQLEVRVNGIVTTGIRLQCEFRDGYPTGGCEVLVEDPIIGFFPLDNKPDFIIEVMDTSKGHVWEKVTLHGLLVCLQNLGVILP